MKLKGFTYDGVSISVAAVAAAAFIAATVFVNPKLALAECIVFIAVAGVVLYRMLTMRGKYKKFILRVSRELDYTDEKVLSNFPFPVAICNEDGYIEWGSERFINEISEGSIDPEEKIEELTGGISPEDLLHGSMVTVQISDRFYTVSANSFRKSGIKYYSIYYFENSTLKKREIEYYLSRPYAILAELDNIDDSRLDYRDSEKTEIRSRLEAMLDEWAESYNSLLKRISDDRYLIVTEQKNFSRMKEDKFLILEKIRNFEYKGNKPYITLSVGVGSGSSIAECEKNSRKAIEMAIGRGGDQVAIKEKDSYEFIGGVSKSAEKRNKVKARVVGSALSELIRNASEVIVMGHSYSDFDALGSALGIAYAARSLGAKAYVAADRKSTLALPLVERIDAEIPDIIIDGEQVSELAGKKSLVILTDTHIESFAEFPEIYESASTKVIIDHHRRAVAQIENVIIFHHDPGASSASEMVTELIQYMGQDIVIPKLIAEALMSGIMLDTKNFIIRSGVRTFEAAALLKDCGADTVSVKKLFANSLEVNKLRNEVISSAEKYKDCAISAADFKSDDIRIISAQAADEMLNINDIKASFVLYESGGAVNISARSLGEINVQLIMEALGGGGHQTMAACSLKGGNMADARTRLCSAIDDFYAE